MNKKMTFNDYATEIMNFYTENGINLGELPKIKIDKTPVSKFDPFISTGNYNYIDNIITLYIDQR